MQGGVLATEADAATLPSLSSGMTVQLWRMCYTGGTVITHRLTVPPRADLYWVLS
jgi:hypothetical protein